MAGIALIKLMPFSLRRRFLTSGDDTPHPHATERESKHANLLQVDSRINQFN
jgi:hypothetical protein